MPSFVKTKKSFAACSSNATVTQLSAFVTEVERSWWQLAVQVGSQSISPLFWALRRKPPKKEKQTQPWEVLAYLVLLLDVLMFKGAEVFGGC